ncbi:MAG TPA: hypothetical protein VNZ64_23280 [Candidatus Acidoferrum sp.]|jgi:hypothetical protein|nr:hypothetical protein [Candidatus Acidoferrum sp.]
MKFIAKRDFSQGLNNPLKTDTGEMHIKKSTCFHIGGDTPCDKYGDGLSADDLKIFRMFAGTGVFVPFDSEEGRQVLTDIERAKTPRERRAEEFKSLNRRQLFSMDDKKLAEWQSRFQADEPQWRLAEHEWQRRKDRGTSVRGWIAIGISLLSLVVAVFALLRK